MSELISSVCRDKSTALQAHAREAQPDAINICRAAYSQQPNSGKVHLLEVLSSMACVPSLPTSADKSNDPANMARHPVPLWLRPPVPEMLRATDPTRKNSIPSAEATPASAQDV